MTETLSIAELLSIKYDSIVITREKVENWLDSIIEDIEYDEKKKMTLYDNINAYVSYKDFIPNKCGVNFTCTKYKLDGSTTCVCLEPKVYDLPFDVQRLHEFIRTHAYESTTTFGDPRFDGFIARLYTTDSAVILSLYIEEFKKQDLVDEENKKSSWCNIM
jgi:hypothetical protein